MNEVEANEQLFETIAGVTRRFKFGKTKVYELIANGQLEAVKFGTKTLIPERSVQALFERIVSRQGEAA